MFDSWIIQHCICKKNEYSHYLVKADSDDALASFWVIDFPASADDLLVLEENGMTREQAIDFFRQAAEDFLGSIRSESKSVCCESLLLVTESSLVENDDQTVSVLLLTQNVISLSSILMQGYLPVEEVIKLGLQMCDAVSCIRSNDMPRRLLTIDNIFADSDGNYLLGCFGSESDTRFQSPEEHRGEKMQYNSEVHSIGVILYTLLNDNRLPLLPADIQQPTYEDIAIAVQNRHAGVPLPPPKHCSAAFTGIVLKACSYKPKARFASVDDFKSALVNLRAGHIVVVSAADVRKVEEANDSFSLKKIISIVSVFVAVLLISNLLIRLISPEQTQVPVAESTIQNSSDGFTVIIHTNPVQTVPSTTIPVIEQPTVAVNNEQYSDEFFKPIAIYYSGHYHLKGVMENADGSKPTELALSRENSIYMTSDIDGSLIGILRDKNGDVYLVDPNAKCYLELSQAILKLIGMDTDPVDKIADKNIQATDFKRPDEIYRVLYRGQDLVCCSYNFDQGKKEKFYLDENGNLQYIEAYGVNTVLENVIIVESFTDNIPPEFIAPTADYTMHKGVKGMIAFVGGLNSTQ